MVASGEIDEYYRSRGVLRVERTTDRLVDFVDADPDEAYIPVVTVTIAVRLDVVQGGVHERFAPWASEQFADAIRDRGSEGLVEAVSVVAKKFLQQPRTLDLWNRRVPRR
jgi:hypothetical protein